LVKNIDHLSKHHSRSVEKYSAPRYRTNGQVRRKLN
jgi:hypothetical protein